MTTSTASTTATDIAALTKKIDGLTAIQKELQSDLRHVSEDLRALTESRRKLLARQFIIENGVKLSDVWMSYLPNTAGLRTLKQFGAWIGRQSDRRPYLEWNEIIAHSEDAKYVRLSEAGGDLLRLNDIREFEKEQIQQQATRQSQ